MLNIIKNIFSKIYTFIYWRIKGINKSINIQSFNVSRIAEFEGNNLVRPGVNIGCDVQFGKYTYASGPGTVIHSAQIGRFCSIALGVKIGLDEHNFSLMSTHPFFYSLTKSKWQSVGSNQTKERPVIEDDVWIGVDAIIMRGVRIGKGAIVGAGAVVTSDVPPYAIVAGVPARVLKFRFNKPLIKQLISDDWCIDNEQVMLDKFKKFGNGR